MDHSQCLKCGNGERGQWKLGKWWLKFHLRVHHASRQNSHYWMTVYDLNHGSDLLRYLSEWCCERDGHQQDHCYAVGGGSDPETLPLFYQNSSMTCPNISIFILVIFQKAQMSCQRCAASCLALSVNAKVCERKHVLDAPQAQFQQSNLSFETHLSALSLVYYAH